MKDRIKRFISSVPFLEKIMFLFFALRSAKAVADESERRKDLSLFDYVSLSQDLPFGPEERVIDNNLYGHMHHMKMYARYTKDSKSYLEHGLFWGGMVHTDTKHWHYKKVITFSKLRKQNIEAKIPSKKAHAIGPYIHYASPLLSTEKMALLKAELGRVLLVFPGHSVKNLEADYNFNQFIDRINELKKDFDTVLISLYFIDALNPEKASLYENYGFKIVTSGHKFDHNFIARQKAIIDLADMTISNEVSTHVGYCIHLNKPHYIFVQDIRRVSTSSSENKRHSSLFSIEEWDLSLKQRKDVEVLFTTYNPNSITQTQKDIVDLYWGTSSIKTPEELADILAK